MPLDQPFGTISSGWPKTLMGTDLWEKNSMKFSKQMINGVGKAIIDREINP